MKKIALLVMILFALSCKNENKKENQPEDNKTESVVKYDIVKSFSEQELITWTKTRVDLEKVESETVGKYSIRRQNDNESCFLSTSLVPVKYAEEYRVSVNAEKSENSNFFGLRLSGSYPDRVDAVFDLEKGELVAVKASRDFEKPNATIENLGNGMYKCTVSAEVAADNVRVLMGPTTADKDVLGWEGKTEELGSIYFYPSTLHVEEKVIVGNN